MRKTLYVLFLVLFMTCSANAQKHNYVIGFYNLENLFDIYDDPAKNDEEFLPEGKNKWTDAKYQKKLSNMARVIRSMKEDNGAYHTILGISEIENRLVIDDLVSDPQIADANYQIVHYDGPDARGVDVALIYRPDQFKYLDSESIPFTFEGSDISFALDEAGQKKFKTRDILMVRGTIEGEMFAFFVAHLPSRIGGKGGDLRSRGAQIIYQKSCELEREFPGIKIAVMGDMNDNPTDESMTRYIPGKENIADVKPGDFFSPFYSMLRAGYGSLAYQGEWNIYDIIQVNYNLAKAPEGGLKIRKIVKNKYYGRVYNKSFLTQQSGQYKGTPFRTWSSGNFIGGYSDHYPTYIVISR